MIQYLLGLKCAYLYLGITCNDVVTQEKISETIKKANKAEAFAGERDMASLRLLN
jgi:hypothetical protein